MLKLLILLVLIRNRNYTSFTNAVHNIHIYSTQNKSIAETLSILSEVVHYYDIFKCCSSSWPKFANEAQSRCLFDASFISVPRFYNFNRYYNRR